jgi:hypothetical protein
MKMRLALLAIGLLVAAALVAGCGGDDKKADSGSSAPASAPATTEASSDGDGGSAAPATPQVQAAVESCKQQIAAQPQISDDVKADLQKICEKAASGDAEAVRQATREVCTKLVEQYTPEGPTREQALTACGQA